jgi:membrane protein YdbS with pleckstrin-like domain
MHAVTGHRITRGRIWILAALALILIAGHGFILYSASKHLALSVGLLVAVALLVVIKHLGFLGPAIALLRRRRGKR